MVDFSDREQVRRWLHGRMPEARTAFAARAALRALPFVSEAGAAMTDLALPVQRALLISGVAVVGPTPEIRDAAVSGAAHAAARASSAFATGFSMAASATCDAASNAIDAAHGAYSDAAASDALYDSADAVGSVSAVRGISWVDVKASAAFDGQYLDTSDQPAGLFMLPLWPERRPEGLDSPLGALRAFWDAEPEVWGFWRRWYDGMLAGEPMDWELQRRVALIPDEVWKDGPGAVAGRIAEIEEELAAEPLDQEALRTHAERLVASPALHADAAEATARLIEESVQRFKVEAPANALPDGFEGFELLAPRFHQISVVLVSEREKDEKIAALQAEINALHETIEELRRDLREANDKLRGARLDRIEAAQTRTFGETLQTTLTNLTLVGAVGMATLTFFGVSADDLNYEDLKSRLNGLADTMRNAQPHEDPPSSPDIHDV